MTWTNLQQRERERQWVTLESSSGLPSYSMRQYAIVVVGCRCAALWRWMTSFSAMDALKCRFSINTLKEDRYKWYNRCIKLSYSVWWFGQSSHKQLAWFWHVLSFHFCVRNAQILRYLKGPWVCEPVIQRLPSDIQWHPVTSSDIQWHPVTSSDIQWSLASRYSMIFQDCSCLCWARAPGVGECENPWCSQYQAGHAFLHESRQAGKAARWKSNLSVPMQLDRSLRWTDFARNCIWFGRFGH